MSTRLLMGQYQSLDERVESILMKIEEQNCLDIHMKKKSSNLVYTTRLKKKAAPYFELMYKKKKYLEIFKSKSLKRFSNFLSF